MNTYTAFCQQASGGGTIWIQRVEASDIAGADVLAQSMCAHDWGCDLMDVHVLGIAAGDVEILLWNDLEE